MREPQTLWLVAARSGSKGFPGKNIRPLGGIPLLAWRVKTALPLAGEVWLSTDSEEYAAIGRKYGAKTPFLRPAEFSSDDASSVDVCLHAMHYAESQGRKFDFLCLLQPTSPFVTTESLRRGRDALWNEPEANGAIAVKEAHPSSFVMQPDNKYLDVLARRFAGLDTRRQALPKEITPCGGFYFVRWNVLKKYKSLYTKKALSILLRGKEVVDIDSEFDFFCVGLI